MSTDRPEFQRTASLFPDPPPAPPASLARAFVAQPRASDAERGAALLEGLNEAQRAAVVHGDGPLLILAGAGSGKTRVITRRIAYLTQVRAVHPGAVLAITFTNKAAGEMRERCAQLGVPHGAWVATFHSTCARILRREIEHLEGYTRDFTIYDTDDRSKLIRDLIKNAGFDTTAYKPGDVGAWISERKNRELAAEGSGEQGFSDQVFQRVYKDYAAALRKNNALDFDDLLVKVIELFDSVPGVRDLYADRFRHVLVDEYQDTNRIQYRMLRHLTTFHRNLAVCGDPDQSIYAWRGADVRNILDFEKDYPGARVVKLEENYRSSQNILDAAQAVIRNNRQRKDKELRSQKGPGEKLAVLQCSDEDDEAREIAFRIRALADEGRSHDEFAIFYRANFMQRALERALRLTSIPYQIVAGTEFYQRREIKDLVAYLRVMVNAQDDEACVRALGVPARGIGDKSIEDLRQWSLDRRVPLLRAVQSEEARALVKGRARAALQAFAGAMERLVVHANGPASIAIQAAIEEANYWEWLAKSAERDEVDREANVQELLGHAEQYDAQAPEGGLRGFLQDIALVSDADGFERDMPKVALMTLHAAKGLEFPCVFVAGVEEDLLPHQRAVAGASGGSEQGIEEERRLFYVGMTRAQERLVLTHATLRRHFGGEVYCRPSRFLDEIPRPLVHGLEDESEALGDYVAEPSAPAQAVLSVGDMVEHDHFGRGRVEMLAGTGTNARASVRFERHGTKQLLLAYARLKKLGGGRR
ncbi:MAG: UvrD-helicase domain-containing protein [Planctomycetes bacterium]|nr:UvrD-helicase domain-containing protein [Planctomycetota bacterium]